MTSLLSKVGSYSSAKELQTSQIQPVKIQVALILGDSQPAVQGFPKSNSQYARLESVVDGFELWLEVTYQVAFLSQIFGGSFGTGVDYWRQWVLRPQLGFDS